MEAPVTLQDPESGSKELKIRIQIEEKFVDHSHGKVCFNNKKYWAKMNTINNWTDRDTNFHYLLKIQTLHNKQKNKP